MILPTASVRTAMPASPIQLATSSLAWRWASVRYVRVSRGASSLMAARRSMRSRMRAPCKPMLGALEENVLRPLPERHLAESRKLLRSFRDGEEMVARELPDLAGKAHAAICQENL